MNDPKIASSPTTFGAGLVIGDRNFADGVNPQKGLSFATDFYKTGISNIVTIYGSDVWVSNTQIFQKL